MTELEKNIEYVDTNRDALLAKHLNRFIVVVDRKVVKAFDNYADAVNYGVRNYGIDERFLVEEMTRYEPLNIVVSAGL